MIEEIANTKYYTLKVDRAKNRMYAEYKGFWPSISVVPDFVADSAKVLSCVTKGCTCITDSRTYKVGPPEVQKLMSQSGQSAKEMVSKTAVVVSADAILQLASKKAAENVNLKMFSDFVSAEAWLDQK
jgi:hypothetical protein